MAIQPPSDILLDVATAADPVKVRAATDRLAKLAADPASANEGFAKALSEAGKLGGAETPTAVTAKADVSAYRPGMRTMSTAKTNVYQKFEALMLQNFVENMLPKDDELYGDKTSADAYRSMMAEQLANQIAKAGGIGISKAVESKHPSGHIVAPSPLEPA